MKHADSPFSFVLKHHRKIKGDVCYMKNLLRKNEIGHFACATSNAGLQGGVTNHSVRKTCVFRMPGADVKYNSVAQIRQNMKSHDACKPALY